MKSYELFAEMPPALALEVLEDVHLVDKPIYRGVLEAVAQSRKVRPVFLERQPRAQRNSLIAGSLAKPSAESVADNILRTWLLKKYSHLLTDFLDALKIKHEKGVVDTLPETIDDVALQAAVENLLQKHRAEIVALYLHAFNDMNEASWPNLSSLLQNDPRLTLRPDQKSA